MKVVCGFDGFCAGVVMYWVIFHCDDTLPLSVGGGVSVALCGVCSLGKIPGTNAEGGL